MELPNSIENKEEFEKNVAADFRSLYKENSEGGYELDPTHSSVVTAISGYKKALNQSRTDTSSEKARLKTLKEQWGQLNQFGQTPEEIMDHISTLSSNSEKGVQELEDQLRERTASIQKKISEASATKIKEYEDRLNSVISQRDSNLIESRLAVAVAGHTNTPDLLIPFLRDRLKVVEGERGVELKVLDTNGNIDVSGTGLDKTVEDLVAEFKEDKKYAPLFAAPKTSGGLTSSNKPLGRSGGKMFTSSQDLIAQGLKNHNL